MQESTDSAKDTRPTILLIEEDEDTYPALKNNLRRQGYRVLLAVCVEDAIDWLDGVHVHADIVLVDLIGKSTDDALSIGRHIRQHAKDNGYTPLVVMAEKYSKDVEGTNVNIGGNDWILYLGEDSSQLQNLLGSLLTQQSGLEEASVI